MTTITALPTPPSRDDPANFDARADAFLPALVEFGDELNALAEDINDAAAAAAASAATALNAPGTSATSTTTLLIGLGATTLSIQSGKAFVKGQPVGVASTASPTNQMRGTITAYDAGSGSLTVQVQSTSGAGTFSDWTIAMTGPVELATGVDVLAGTSETKAATPKAIFDAAVSQPFDFNATLALDLKDGLNRHGAITGNFTLANFSSLKPGANGRLRLTIGGAGGWTMTLGSKFQAFSGMALPTAPGTVVRLDYYVHDANTIEISMARAI